MDRVEVVCVTMGQKDLTIADKMHITGDAVFGNQADGYRKETQLNAGRTLRMITTDTRGVGVNRNIALLHAAGDILLFADDDICYADGYADGMGRAFALSAVTASAVRTFGFPRSSAAARTMPTGRTRCFCVTRFVEGFECIRAASASAPAPRTRPPVFTALMKSIFTIRAFCIGRHSVRLQCRCACAFA